MGFLSGVEIMANPEHVEILKQGVEVWNRWRSKHPGIRPELKQAEFARANLEGANFSGTDLNVANLNGANLSGTNLNRVDLNGAKLADANLLGANLFEAKLIQADLTGANLSRAKLTGTNLQ